MNYSMFDEIDYFTNFKGNHGMDKDTLENNEMENMSYLVQNQDTSNLNLSNPYEAYTRGNLFKDLYQEYEGYKPARISVNNEREEMLLNIGQISFASHELNLFLDNYPNNREALNLFNKYRKMALELIKNYERRYGPLSISSSDMQNIPFKWENDKWPWEV